jgi:hypothetical protein
MRTISVATAVVAKLVAARGLPIIFATGYGAMGLPDEFRGHAALPKPFELNTLAATIEKLALRHD